MKGIIFNVVEEAVVADHDEQTWDTLLSSAGLEGGYSALGDYPDEELLRLIDVGAEALDLPADDLVRHLGGHAVVSLTRRYPHFTAPHRTTREFLLTLNDVIHPEVRKLHHNAHPPHFDFEVLPDGGLRVGYRSTRSLCVLADGMITGAAPLFGERARVVHEKCTRHGDADCVMRCDFEPAEPPG